VSVIVALRSKTCVVVQVTEMNSVTAPRVVVEVTVIVEFAVAVTRGRVVVTVELAVTTLTRFSGPHRVEQVPNCPLLAIPSASDPEANNANNTVTTVDEKCIINEWHATQKSQKMSKQPAEARGRILR